MNVFLDILQFLKDSNQNGFGFFVVSVLFYLFIFFLIQFFQHKRQFYLYYSIYALINAFSLVKYIKNVFFSDFFSESLGRDLIRYLHYPSQILGSLLFTLFILDIMNLYKTYPRADRYIRRFYYSITPIYLLLWVIQLFDRSSYLVDYFHAFIFLPLSLIIFGWTFWLMVKHQNKLKWYILAGMSALCISYTIITVDSIQSKSANTETLYVFYIGVLLESLFFALAIGLEQKMVYQDKVAIQKQYIEQLEENQLIREAINKTLADELQQSKEEIVGLSTEAHKERTQKLAFKVEHKFAQLRLNALRSQMNPHFIFNALNSIKSYFIENNQEKAIYYLGRFSKLIRAILESSRKDMLTIEEELEVLQTYVDIESDRFKKGLQYTVTVSPSISEKDVLIPSLLLQPFVENAIWHGLLTKKGEKTLDITLALHHKDRLLISITDNGIGRAAAKLKQLEHPTHKQSVGISIVEDRLEFFTKKYNKEFGYVIHDVIEKQEAKGTKVVLELPIIYTDQLNQ